MPNTRKDNPIGSKKNSAVARNDNMSKRTPRTVLTRKIKRNILKKRIGSNNISESWHNYQISNYSKALAYLKERKDANKDSKKFDGPTLLKFIRSPLKRKKVI